MAVEGVPALVVAWVIVFAMNAVTFPLPPAWTVLAAFRSYTQVPLLPLTIGGSAAAALGRLLFAWQVKTFTGRLPRDAQSNAQALAAAAHSRMRWPWLFVVIYSFLPISELIPCSRQSGWARCQPAAHSSHSSWLAPFTTP